jgi:hypothetical protein
MDTKLTKSLTDLIDETLQELDELRKSRFAAAEISVEGPGEGIAGKPSDGELDAKKADKEDEDEDMEMDKAEDEEESEEESEEVEKAEPKKKLPPVYKPDTTSDPADSPKTKKDIKDLTKKEDDEDEDHPHKKETKDKAEDLEEGAKAIKELHKSLEETESLMKSYVEERVKPLEDKLSTILDLVNQIAEQPVAAKGVTARTTPLLKSAEEFYTEPLSKTEVANKLFELKKSGVKVSSDDVIKAEMGQNLEQIIKKYEIS